MKSLLSALCVVSLLALSGCNKADAKDSPPPDAQAAAAKSGSAPKKQRRVRVEVARMDASEARLDFTFPGEVKGARDALLAAPLGGLVEAVLVQQGDKVKKGQQLLRIDTEIYAVRRDQAKADTDQAKADLARLESMKDNVARAQLEGAQTRVRISEASLRLAQAQLSRSVITAPFDGTVAQLDLEPGEVSAPGAPVLRLVQLSPVKVTLSVADRDITALKPGMPVSITTDASPEVFEGKIAYVSPTGNLRTRAFEAEVEVENKQSKLLPGMIARAKVTASVAESRLVVPQYVMVTRGETAGVFVIDAENTAQWRPLQLGPVVGDQVVLAGGLEAGERVVVTGHRELLQGDKLETTREGICCNRGRVTFGGEATR